MLKPRSLWLITPAGRTPLSVVVEALRGKRCQPEPKYGHGTHVATCHVHAGEEIRVRPDPNDDRAVLVALHTECEIQDWFTGLGVGGEAKAQTPPPASSAATVLLAAELAGMGRAQAEAILRDAFEWVAW